MLARHLRSPCAFASRCHPARVCSTARQVRVLATKDDVLLRSLSEMGEVAVLVVDGTNLVAEAARRHRTAPTASAALGRTLLGALLLGSFRKEDEVVQISFRGDGPVKGIMAIADTRGNVKGKVGDASADPPLRPDGKLNVGAAIGEGLLAVVRSHPLEPNPYTGMVPIVSGEVAEDIANYLVDSEQSNSALGLGVSLNRDCSVRSAGGFLVSILPFCSEETLDILEANLRGLPSATQMLNGGDSVHDITMRILDGLGVAPESSTITPRYGPCDPEDLKRVIASLGREEVRGIVEDVGKIEATCDFCNEPYTFSEESILEVIEQRERDYAARQLA